MTIEKAFKAGWDMSSTAGAEDEWEDAYAYWSLDVDVDKDVGDRCLGKRPSAFEVIDPVRGSYLTFDEDEARESGHEYSGLYRRDGEPVNVKLSMLAYQRDLARRERDDAMELCNNLKVIVNNHQESNIQIAFQLDALKRHMKELGYKFPVGNPPIQKPKGETE